MEQITPIVQALPSTTSIQDPAARKFAQAVSDALKAIQSAGGAVDLLAKAAAEMSAGDSSGSVPVSGSVSNRGTPSVVAEWLFKSELYSTLTRQINDIDVSGQVAAGIAQEAQTRADNDLAVMNAVNTAWAAIGVNNALIQSGEAIQTNWNATQASKWTQLESEVFTSGGLTIRQALAEEMTVRSNADGSLFAQYTVKVDQNGYVSGFGFASTANNGSPTSEFVVLADRFAVVTPGDTPRTPFAVFGGVTYIDSAMIRYLEASKIKAGAIGVDQWISSTNYSSGVSGWQISHDGTAEFQDIVARGDIEATSIKVDVIDIVKTAHIQGEAVTVLRSATGSQAWSSPSSAWYTMATLPVTGTGGAPVILIGSTQNEYNYTGAYPAGVRFLRNGSVIGPANGFVANTDGYASSTATGVYISAGDANYTLQIARGWGGTNSGWAFTCLSTKR